jgi:hypothetical protein
MQAPFYEGGEHVSGHCGPAAMSHTYIALAGPQKSPKRSLSKIYPDYEPAWKKIRKNIRMGG